MDGWSPPFPASDRYCGPSVINYLTTSKTWHAYKTTTVGPDGFFHFSEAKSHGYYFKVVLPAQGAFRSCTSRTL
jgi:hypothetical protein